MQLYKQLSMEHANKIIILKNKKLSNYRINKITGISKGKIRRCLYLSEITKTRQNIQSPWKGPHIST